ncbi:hypothetical protein P175DRAFT_0419815, partial [Aspergillus ochraceoroseus IBT 24754]
WIQVPFSAFKPSPMQSLLNQVLEMLALLQDMDMIVTDPYQASARKLLSIFRALLDIHTRLESWEQSPIADINEPCYWRISPPLTETAPKSAAKSIWFPDITLANVYTHLW